MDRLTIHPTTHESALGLLSALSGFDAELSEDDGAWEIVVTFGASGRGSSEIVAVLNALERHVTARAGDPARVQLNGHSYLMHPVRG